MGPRLSPTERSLPMHAITGTLCGFTSIFFNAITVPLVARLLYRLNEYSVCIIHLVSARSFKFVSSAAAAGE